MHGYERWRHRQTELEYRALSLVERTERLRSTDEADDAFVEVIQELAQMVKILIQDRPSWKRVG